ncbi:MAG: phosphatidylglycerophosphatase A [Deltaproteobacteria bacterium]|nr:phosphatidylglycerophosphatase A [Deltaproteobacteria bacterium]
MHFWDKAAVFFATGCYVGKIPVAPGTAGTAAGLPLAYLVSLAPVPHAFFFIILFTGMAVLGAHYAEAALGKKDPGEIVIDEIAGIVITFVGLTMNARTLAIGFVLFRVLDIFKPFPIRWIDRRIPGGGGVVLDDVIAGIYANLILRVINQWIL